MPNDTQPQQTAVTARPEKAVVHDSGLFHNLMDTSRFEHLQRVANVFANSSLVPEHFRGKAADCFIAVEMAMRLKLHPFNLMQSLYVVHGKPGIEAKMAIALINSSGLFEGPLQFKLSGDGMKRQCTAFAVHAKTRQVCETAVTMEMAKAEGWIDKSGSKWKTLPDLMLQYRSASFFARLYCPEVIFGMQTREELEEIDVTPTDEQPIKEQAAPRRSGLKERVTGRAPIDATPERAAVDKETGEITSGPEASVEDLVKAGAIVIHDEEPAGDAQATPGTHPDTEGRKAPQEAAGDGGRGPGMGFEAIERLAKKARTKDQAEIVLDAMNGSSLTPDQVKAVKAIIAEKQFGE